MRKLSAPLCVTNLSKKQPAILSTEMPKKAGSVMAAKPYWRAPISGRPEELCLPPMTCAAHNESLIVILPVDGLGERKESVREPFSRRLNSNRKERLNSNIQTLLIPANTSGMHIFADQQRHQIAAADEVVMVRGAERAAGGCDVI